MGAGRWCLHGFRSGRLWIDPSELFDLLEHYFISRAFQKRLMLIKISLEYIEGATIRRGGGGMFAY